MSIFRGGKRVVKEIHDRKTASGDFSTLPVLGKNN
jgi:hypothetical protein